MTTRISRQTHCLRHTSSTSRRMCTAKSNFRHHSKNRNGLTLIEIMIALTMTLIVLGAMAQAFKFASGEIAKGRATLEMSNLLRNAEQLLRTDLAGLTVEVRPHTESVPDGYFEYVEGPGIDSSAAGTLDGYLGDVDDVLAFTSRNLEGKFRGRVNYPTGGGAFRRDIVQSAYAEIIWYTDETDVNNDGIVLNADGNINYNDTISLYRRVLLIRPNLNDGTFLPLSTGEFDADAPGGDLLDNPAYQQALMFFVNNDISARWIDSNGDGNRDQIVANSLADLGRRENRFGHDSTVYPHEIDIEGVKQTKAGAANLNGAVLNLDFSGDDIVLTNLAAFDLQVYSPDLNVDMVDVDGVGGEETFVASSEAGYTGWHDASSTTVPAGGFVDLGADPDGNQDANDPVTGNRIYNFFDRSNPLKRRFTTAPVLASQEFDLRQDFASDPANCINFSSYYCTWSPHYESDGVNQADYVIDRSSPTQETLTLIDEGTNGFDDDRANGVDDDGEKETSPPYPYPVRGLKTTFRVIEKNTKQLRQTSVIQNFLPQ